MTMRRAAGWCLALAMIGVLITPAAARDAAFVAPNAANGGAGDDAIKVEPKGTIDVGDTSVNMARRTTLFFVNESSAPVQVEKVAVNSDANVLAEITGDDCSKQGTIAPGSRCSVEVSITPSSPGEWTAEALLTHNGAGRIARAMLTGKTSGTVSTGEKKETGLALSSKEVTPVNFGDVEVGGTAARSALMVNDSPDPITLYSIDVIEANNGLKILDGGCAVDMELKPGESCPVTLVWNPTNDDKVSTDLIIRHSGRQGFAVIPIRGNAKGGAEETASDKDKNGKSDGKEVKSSTPLPPTADELDKAMAGKIGAVAPQSLAPKLPPGELHLIGTVGNRGVLLLPDGSTKIVDDGDEVPLGDDKTAKVVHIDAKSIDLMMDGKKKHYVLGEAPELISKATADRAKQAKSNSDKKSNSPSSPAAGSATSVAAKGAGNVSGASQ